MKKPSIIKITLSILIALKISPAISQGQKDFSSKEKEYYNTLKGFCQYLETTPDPLKTPAIIYKRWVVFDYALNDTSQSRKETREKEMDQLLAAFKHFLDSAGVDNLEAAPIRFYKDSIEFFKPFAENLSAQIPVTFAYFNKNKLHRPIGYLLFDEKTGKLVSWILINQGGYYYFLTLNLM
jgi:hypothetical protein